VAEATQTPGGVGQPALGYRHELGLLHRLDDELGDSVTPVNLVRARGVCVDEQDTQFVPVAGIDEAGGVETRHTVAKGEPAPRLYETGVARWKGDGHTRGHEGSSSAGSKHGVVARVEVGPGIALARIGGHRQVGIEEDEGHLEHRMTLSSTHEAAPGRQPRDASGSTGSIPRVLVWMDLEMTGLEPARHVIVEMATLVTDDDLTVIADGPDLVVHVGPEQLQAMEPVVRAMHTRSGLLAAIEASTLTLDEAGRQTLDFLKTHVPVKGSVPLCGNSIGTDRRFLAAQLPEIENWLHYRSIDVSTVKELCRRWYPDVLAQAPAKKTAHRALDDVRESVAELAFYRKAIFAPSSETPAPQTNAAGVPPLSGPSS
jgi:oligoribonuclease